jgi:hypothetical protein
VPSPSPASGDSSGYRPAVAAVEYSEALVDSFPSSFRVSGCRPGFKNIFGAAVRCHLIPRLPGVEASSEYQNMSVEFDCGLLL